MNEQKSIYEEGQNIEGYRRSIEVYRRIENIGYIEKNKQKIYMNRWRIVYIQENRRIEDRRKYIIWNIRGKYIEEQKTEYIQKNRLQKAGGWNRKQKQEYIEDLQKSDGKYIEIQIWRQKLRRKQNGCLV